MIFIQHEAGDLEYNSAGWQLQPGLQVKDGDTKLRKTTPDSFFRTELETLLAAWHAGHIVICGYASEFCIDTTIRRAAALGYAVTLASDAHTTHDKPHATGQQIRAHENATLPNLDSFDPEIKAVATSELRIAS